MPEYTTALLEGTEEGLAWLWPGDSYYPTIPSVKMAIKHDPRKTLKLLLNGEEVGSLSFDGTVRRQDNKVAVSVWRGVHLAEGDNHFRRSRNTTRAARKQGNWITSSTIPAPPVKAELVPAKSRLVGGRQEPAGHRRPVDRQGRPAGAGRRHRRIVIDPPYVRASGLKTSRKNPLTASTSDDTEIPGRRGRHRPD